jgi:alginate O-acetyltransferase complex protein AlgJ
MLAQLRHCRLFVTLAFICALLMVVGRSGLPAPDLVENRTLASWPDQALLVGNFAGWRAGVDSWVTDNFPARRHLIGALNVLRWRLGYSGTPRVVVGADGWLFYDDSSHLAQVRPSTLTSPDLTVWVGELQARTDHLRAKGIPYVVLAAPVKESIYRELVPRILEQPGTTNAQAIAAAVRAAGLDNYLDLHPALNAAKQYGLAIYSPYDTHWTDEGAYVAYAEVVRDFARRGLDVQVAPRTGFRLQLPEVAPVPQDLAYMLGIASFVHQNYPQLAAADGALPHITWIGAGRDWTADRVIDTGSRGPVVLITGDSFSNAWMPLMERSFSRIIFSHHQNGFFRRDLVERFKPDAVLLEVIESGIRHAMPPATQQLPTAPASMPAPPLGPRS